MKQCCLNEHWSIERPLVLLWTGIALVAALVTSCAYETNPAGYARPSVPASDEFGRKVVAEDGYTEESFPYARLFEGGFPSSGDTPLEWYRHAIEDARETGSVPLIVCFEKPFDEPVGQVSAEEEQRYIDAVSAVQDRIVNSIRKGNVGKVKKFVYAPCVSIRPDETALKELLPMAEQLGIMSVSEQVGIPLPGGVSMRMDAVGKTGSLG